MDLSRYFDNHQGTGVLSTADSHGRVNAAVYSKPHIMEDGSLVFIMRDRLTHHNLQSNPHAAYLFYEAGGGYDGCRLYLTKIGEEHNTERIKTLCRRCRVDDAPETDRFLVLFKLDRHLPLIGGGSPGRGRQ